MIDTEQIKGRQLFKDLTWKEQELFFEIAHPKVVSVYSGQTLITQGQVADTFWVVISGELSASYIDYNGEKYFVRLYIANELIAVDTIYQKSWESPFQIIADKKSKLLAISPKFITNSNLDKSLLNKFLLNIGAIYADESGKNHDRFRILLCNSVRVRIAIFLNSERKRLESNDFEINLNRDQLARHLGTHRVSLSRELGKMRDEGLINYHKGHFVILDKAVIKWEDMKHRDD